jgi:hypothetical protein
MTDLAVHGTDNVPELPRRNSGIDDDAQSSHQEIFPPLTRASYQRPFAAELERVTTEGARNFTGRDAAGLINSKYQELEQEYRRCQSRISELETTRDADRDKVKSLEVELAELRIVNQTLKSYRWVEAFLYVVGSLLASAGISEAIVLGGSSVAPTAIGIAMIIFGLFSQFFLPRQAPVQKSTS